MTCGVYVHTPFCATQCPYCDFYSGVFPAERVGPLIEAVATELRARRAALPEGPVGTVYVGGGTPSHLPAAALTRLLDAVREHVLLDPDAEITVEVNPESFDREKARLLGELGVNRISVGVQSLDDAVLRYLGRPHDAAQALAAARLARQCFPNVSFDLILAVPGSTRDSLVSTLDRLLELAPDHLSAYGLTIEPGTPFGVARERGRLCELDDEASLEQDALVEARALAAGLERYEVSNYARPGRECRHNLDIWRGGWYLGIGPSAHSKLPGDGRWGMRTANARDLDDYVAEVERSARAVVERETIDLDGWIEERLLLGLRTAEGIDLAELQSVAAQDGPVLRRAEVDRLVDGGFLAQERDRLRVTAEGRRVLDEVIARLAIAVELEPVADIRP